MFLLRSSRRREDQGLCTEHGGSEIDLRYAVRERVMNISAAGAPHCDCKSSIFIHSHDGNNTKWSNQGLSEFKSIQVSGLLLTYSMIGW